jgi:hypothetical protein
MPPFEGVFHAYYFVLYWMVGRSDGDYLHLIFLQQNRLERGKGRKTLPIATSIIKSPGFGHSKYKFRFWPTGECHECF